jgi:two-component system, chemotaxis family, sensor kinase CheA
MSVLRRIATLVVLPREMTTFERSYLARVNRIALVFLVLHVPVFALVAWLNDTGPLLAIALTSAVAVGPVVAYFALDNARAVSVVDGVTAMCMGGLLVHFGQGPVQIEMHFYFFALIAMCCVFGNPMVIVAATVTVALHHLLVWLVLPSSVFNYEAQWWVVSVHATFVVLEAIAACVIARSFFENVIGLERIVQVRTREVDDKNRDMRVLLDNVDQGFATIDRNGRLAGEHSAAIDRWFGTPAPNQTWFDFIETVAPRIAASSRVSWQAVVDDMMPLEVTLAQMPATLTVGETTYRVEYRPIGAEQPPAAFLVIVTDIARERAEDERGEVMALFEHVLADRAGLEAFVEDGGAQLELLRRGEARDLDVVQRIVHTLKGNAALFGVASIARACHTIEDRIDETGAMPAANAYDELDARWRVVVAEVNRLVGDRRARIELDTEQVAALETAARARDSAQVAQLLARFQLEPTRTRLRHLADQATRIAERLGKPGLVVHVEDHGARLDRGTWAPFWHAFVHAVRNAIDHGIEPGDARVLAGKPLAGSIWLRTFERSDGVLVELEDDGAGIDWAAIRARAKALGLPCATASELEVALFADGCSTAGVVTETSGRGIGLGALRHATMQLGGVIEIHSRRGAGTTFRMRFPSAHAPPVAIAS